MITLRIKTQPGTNASDIGARYAAYDGSSWRDSIDRCDCDGCGRVFIDCDDREAADYALSQMAEDDDIASVSEL